MAGVSIFAVLAALRKRSSVIWYRLEESHEDLAMLGQRRAQLG